MATLYRSDVSCGLVEAGELYEDESSMDSVTAIVRELYREYSLRPAFVLFSDAIDEGNGRGVAAYIRAHKLGTVMKTRKALNENSGHMIEAWIWTIDRVACKDYLVRQEVI
jgi:hypothetical protein